MNKRAKHYLMQQMGDGRNPYGSRGGYVTSYDPRRRDRGQYEDERGMDFRQQYDNGRGYPEYGRPPYEEMRGDFEYSRQYYDGNNPNDMRGDYRGGRGGDYGDYGDYGDDYGDYRGGRGGRGGNRGGGRSRGGDRGRGDYGDDEEEFGKLSKRDIKEWEENMVNNDGSRGFHFTKEQAEQTARQIGIDPNEFDECIFWVTMNFKYSDGCLTAKKFGVDRPEYYAEEAKEFLKEDKDYQGKGAEKLYLYYEFIASK